VEVDQRRIRVPVDAPALADLADSTGGTAYEASGDELEDVHDDIGSAVGTTTEPREVSAGVAGLALLSAVGAGAAALAWSPRSLGRPAPCPGRAGPLAIMESLHMAHAQQAPARGQQLHDRRRRAPMPHPRINRRRSPAPP
jgi:hypothetical protein